MPESAEKKLPNRVTCTLCGDFAERDTITQIIEWDKAHLCPKKAEKEAKGG